MKIGIDHPFHLIERILLSIPQDSTIEFSIYEHEPQSLLDKRDILEVEAKNLTLNYIEKIINHLQPEQELAMHSRIRFNKKVYHVPMIDFRQTESETIDAIYKLKRVIPNKIYNELVIFNSGRSCHGYSLKLISQREWFDFMGRLLLASMPNEAQIIDTRWVGHRLMAGYSSLRWSNNTGNYIHMPKKIKPA